MSIVGFRARNHRQQVGKRGADDSTDDRRTPQDLFDALNAEFRFTLDAAASHENTKCAKYFTLDNSGLVARWSDERVWCNPPYSNMAEWVKKAEGEVVFRHCPLVVMLAPANRTEQSWWQNHVEIFRDKDLDFPFRLRTRFLRGRIRFERPNWTKPAKGDRPPFGLVLLIWERSA